MIELENPSNQDVKLKTLNSNIQNFETFPKEILIKAFQT
jgi:hypothetical protein